MAKEGVILSRSMYERLVKMLDEHEHARPERYVQPPLMRRPMDSGGYFIRAQITKHTLLDSPVARWGYDWQQVDVTAAGGIQVTTNGLTGTYAAGTHAFNLHEYANVEQRAGVQGDGVDQESDDYQSTSFNLLPIGGGSLTTGDSANSVIVWIKIARDVEGNLIREFSAVNAHDGECDG